MPKYFYVSNDTLTVYTPTSGELRYEIYSSDGNLISSGKMVAKAGFHKIVLDTIGEIKVYMNNIPIRKVSKPKFKEYKAFISFKGEKLIIRVFVDKLEAKYRILTRKGDVVKEEHLGILSSGEHTFKMNAEDLRLGSYILEVQVGDEVKRYKFTIEEE